MRFLLPTRLVLHVYFAAFAQPGAIERLLKLAKIKIAKFKEEGRAG